VFGERLENEGVPRMSLAESCRAFAARMAIVSACSMLAIACDASQETAETPAAAGAEPGIVIRDVMLASPERDAAYGPVSVRIVGGRIERIGAKLPASASDTVIDGTGRYLAPGLIDSHVHLGDVPGFRAEDFEAHPEAADAAQEQTPRSYLFHGFTTVVDLASNSAAIAAWNAEDVRPQAYFCGAAPVQDGYPTNFAPAPQRYALMPDYLHDPATSAALPEGDDAALHTPEAVVARIADSGAVCVKTYFERGFGPEKNLPVPGEELIRVLVGAAHARELPVLLHANSQSAQAFGIATGVDAYAHGMWHWNDTDAAQVDGAVADEIRQAVTAGIALQPTIQVLYGEGELLDPDFLERPGLADVYPPSQLGFYASEDGRWFRDILADNVYGDGWSPESPFVQRVKAATRYFAEQGGRLLFGSDTPSAPTYANPPGLNSRWEMDRWVEAGIPARAVFRAATVGNAAFFKLDDEIGTVETGKRADLLLLDGDPFESVTAFDGIVTVFVGGRPVERAALSARH
jgi:imidazolonepropionase-like amidohydrolase